MGFAQGCPESLKELPFAVSVARRKAKRQGAEFVFCAKWAYNQKPERMFDFDSGDRLWDNPSGTNTILKMSCAGWN